MFTQLCLFSTADIQEVESRLASMASVLQSCPEPNWNTFLYLLHHLQRSDSKISRSARFGFLLKIVFLFLRVAEKQNTNKMCLKNLATVFGPSLVRPPVAGLGHDGVPVDISQEVVVQVRSILQWDTYTY